MIFSVDVIVALMIWLSIIFTQVFLFGSLGFWGVTFNSISMVNIIVSIALSSNFCVHVGHAFLQTQAPDENEDGDLQSNHQRRVYKARQALAKMGGSILHGAFSSFLAIVSLSSGSTITAQLFCIWFGTYLYSFANAFVLLPVMLSLCGPLNRKKEHHGYEDVF